MLVASGKRTIQSFDLAFRIQGTKYSSPHPFEQPSEELAIATPRAASSTKQDEEDPA